MDERVAQILPSLPPGVELEVIYRRDTLVNNTLSTVKKSLLEGGILVVLVLLILLAGYLLPRTRYGRRTIAVGGNRAAAKARGISLVATRFGVFMAASGFVGFAAVLFAASSGPFNPGSGNTLQLNVIASVILAGISLAGGRGNLWLLLLSVGFLSTIPTALVFFGLSSDTQSIFQGLILVIAVAIDGYRARRGTP